MPASSTQKLRQKHSQIWGQPGQQSKTLFQESKNQAKQQQQSKPIKEIPCVPGIRGMCRHIQLLVEMGAQEHFA
jgi:hypothetical protein